MPQTFDHTTPSGNQADRYTLLKNAFESVEEFLETCVPPGRELSLAKTKLEELAMWANKGISRGDEIFNAEVLAVVKAAGGLQPPA